MVDIYTTSNSKSCRKTIEWMNQNNVRYKEKNTTHDPLTREEIEKLFVLTAEGTLDIISRRSKAFKKIQSKYYNNMKLSELIDYVVENQTILRRPIIVDGDKMQVGFAETEITAFLPRDEKIKRFESKEWY